MDYDKTILDLQLLRATLVKWHDDNSQDANSSGEIESVDNALAALRELMAEREPLGDAQTTTEQLSEQIEELKTDNLRLRKAIEEAPHAYRCEIGNITTPKKCTCWKRNALESDKAAK